MTISRSPLSSGPPESAQQNSSTGTSTGGSLLQRALKKDRVWERIQRSLQKTGRQSLQAREQHTRRDHSCCQSHTQDKLDSFKKRHRRQAPNINFQTHLGEASKLSDFGKSLLASLAQQVEALYIGMGNWAWDSELMRKARHGAMQGSPSNRVWRLKTHGVYGPVSPAKSVLYGPLVREPVSTKRRADCLKTTFAAPKPNTQTQDLAALPPTGEHLQPLTNDILHHSRERLMCGL